MPQDNNSYYRTNGDIPLLNCTIPRHFTTVAERFADHEAVVSLPQGKRLTYKELADAVEQLALGLCAMGFGKGDRIGIWSTNNIEWLLLQLATSRIGAILVTINPAYLRKELTYALQQSQIQGLFMIPSFRSNNYIETLKELMPELQKKAGGVLRADKFPFLRYVVIYEPGCPEKSIRPAPGFTIWPEVLEAGAHLVSTELKKIDATLDPQNHINIQYTSGTTGFPKAVVLSHYNILNNAYFSALAMHFTEQDRLCVPVPFYHCFGMVLANLLCLSVGACIVIACEHFDALKVLQAVDKEKCTGIHGVPTMFIAALEHPRFQDFDLSTLRTGIMAGAPCPPALMKKVMSDMHCPEILIGYGETEASPLTHLTSRDNSLERRTETVGRNLPHQEVKIVDPMSGEIVPLETIGEICFRGYHVMHGYYGDPQATAEAISKDGWLHSGDLGTMDADGYVRITGRLKEMIIRGGENIYPREIEDLIYTHPKVAAVSVFGIPDRFYGEEIVAWIKTHADATVKEQEIKEYCRHNLAHFKVPRHVWFVEEFPMTVTGKIQKFRMKELTMAKLHG